MSASGKHKGGKPSQIRFGKYRMNLPGTKRSRVALGTGLVLGGCLGFLPILGFWMIPLGILVLSVDLHPVRRMRRKFDIYWGRRRASKGRIRK